MDATGQQEGDIARIISPIQTPGVHCLTLWYNMNSWNLGALNIYVKTVNGKESLVFTKYTSIGSRRWQKAVISRNTNVQFQVSFINSDYHKNEILFIWYCYTALNINGIFDPVSE